MEGIEVGDKVLAYDETTGEQAYKEVVRLFRNETDEWYHITANGEELVCTGGHPFFVKDKGFVSAKNLSVDDILRLSNGALIPVSAISVEKLENPETTYNFEVADFHTYYVGESEVLVHNTCGANSATPEQDLYRAMSNEEYGSLTKYNEFRHKLGTMQDKWLATSYDDAKKWGNTLMGEGNFRVVKITVPTNSLKNMFYVNYSLDGIGMAYCANYKYLNEVMISFTRVL